MKAMIRMKEIWKDIPEYEGYYQISNLGRIKSLISFNGHKFIHKEKILKPQKNRYLTVRLAKNKNIKQYTVHRLVAKVFLLNKENKPCVNHIDGNKYNNNINNLEWVTYKENTAHAYKNNLITKNSEIKKISTMKNIKKAWEKNKKIIYQYDLSGKFIKKYSSLSQASEYCNISIQCISDCCRKKTCSAGGYKWNYN